jgi:hypothetical protein
MMDILTKSVQSTVLDSNLLSKKGKNSGSNEIYKAGAL